MEVHYVDVFSVRRSIRASAAVLAEEQMTLDVKTGAKSKPSRSPSGAGEGDEYGRPKVRGMMQLECHDLELSWARLHTERTHLGPAQFLHSVHLA